MSRITSKEIFEFAFQGDEFCLELIDNFIDEVGRALASVSCVCDPDIIVIGGGVSNAGEKLLTAVKQKFISCYRKHTFLSGSSR